MKIPTSTSKEETELLNDEKLMSEFILNLILVFLIDISH